MPIFDELTPCGEPIALDPANNEEDAACISGLAEEIGPDVADFFAATDQFLFDFESRPGIDTGTAGAPWFNMGRGELVFLNGSPDVIFAAEHVRPTWSDAQQYRDFIGESTITAWFEYWTVESAAPVEGGGESFVIAYNLQECRACEVVGFLRIQYVFDAGGALTGASVRSRGCAPDLTEPDSSCHKQ